jgi:mannose-1-phosphate guanylyltransferase
MSLSPNTHHRWAVVLAGGDGTRLQELTYRIAGDARPKQFCHFFGGKSLLGHTRERIGPLFDDERTLFVLSRAHETYYRPELAEVPARNTVIQSANRGTATALALCLHVIAQQDEDALVSFFPSDHYYSNSSAFHESIESGLRLIKEYPDCILVVGAEARYPEVEYGWIQPGRTLVDSLANPLLRVSRFWEKPALKRAEAATLYLEQLHHDWPGWSFYGTASRHRAPAHTIVGRQLHERPDRSTLWSNSACRLLQSGVNANAGTARGSSTRRVWMDEFRKPAPRHGCASQSGYPSAMAESPSRGWQDALANVS